MPYKKINKICPICNKEYLALPLQKYCSYDCHNKSGVARKPRKGKNVKCAICQKTFYRSPSGTTKYCSYKCSDIGKKKQEKKICHTCGKFFERATSTFKWGKKRGNKNSYCSIKCSNKGSALTRKGIIKSKIWTMRRADSIFSDFIRNRDGWQCRYCGKLFWDKSGQLHNSHFWSRAHWSTRFDPSNCIALCYSCHKWKLETEKQGIYKQIMIDWLGQEKYDLLEKKSQLTVKKYDSIKEFMNWIEPLLKDIEIPQKRNAMASMDGGIKYWD